MIAAIVVVVVIITRRALGPEAYPSNIAIDLYISTCYHLRLEL